MEKVELENDRLRVVVSTCGAELESLYSKDTNLEYLWQPGSEIWPRHSMLLFPNAGRIARDRVLIDGKVYPARMHGFAYDMEFRQISREEAGVCEKNRLTGGEGVSDSDVESDDQKSAVKEAWFELRDNAHTQRYFPYHFRFQVGFILKDDMLIQRFRVINDDDRTMYFSLGAHPGFYCPIDLAESADEYSLVFDCPQNIDRLEMEPHTRLRSGETTPFLDGTDEIPLGEHFFDNGPMLLGGVKANSITLCSKRSGHFMEMGIADFPYMCLWGVPGKMALIAIEPWCGISDAIDADHIWEHRQGTEAVGVGEVFERELTFRTGRKPCE